MSGKAIVLLVVIGFVVYGFCFFNAFVWDDIPFIANNSDVYSVNIIYLLGPNNFNNSLGQYRALTAIYFALVHAMVGNAPFLYHVLQVVMHIANSILVYWVLGRLIKKDYSLLAALVFLVHPIQVESVAYIGATGNTLFFLFGILGLLLGMQPQAKPTSMAVMASCFVAALLAKETGIVFLVLTLLYQAMFNKRSLLNYLVWSGMAVGVYLGIRLGIGGVQFQLTLGDSIIPILRLSLGDRLINIPAVIYYYLRTFIFPQKLIIDQLWIVSQVTFESFYLPLILDTLFFLGILGFGAYLYRFKRNFKAYVFFTIWFGIGLAMHSQVVALNATVADRWFYFSIVGILGMIGVGLGTVTQKIVWGVGVCLVCLLSIRTVVRIFDWKDQLTLYAHDSKMVDNFDIENTLGNELNKVGRYDEAIQHFEKSIRLFPHETNLFNLALTYETLNSTDSAEKYYYKALNSRNMGQVPYPHKHREILYRMLARSLLGKDAQKAEEVIDLGLEDYPNSSQLWVLKFVATYQAKRVEEAKEAAQKAYALEPTNSKIKDLYERLTTGQAIGIIYY
jgi:protein O-mannosyl-transferase